MTKESCSWETFLLHAERKQLASASTCCRMNMALFLPQPYGMHVTTWYHHQFSEFSTDFSGQSDIHIQCYTALRS